MKLLGITAAIVLLISWHGVQACSDFIGDLGRRPVEPVQPIPAKLPEKASGRTPAKPAPEAKQGSSTREPDTSSISQRAQIAANLSLFLASAEIQQWTATSEINRSALIEAIISEIDSENTTRSNSQESAEDRYEANLQYKRLLEAVGRLYKSYFLTTEEIASIKQRTGVNEFQ
jgi:hypothetical protein